jgi:hypothetical protein
VSRRRVNLLLYVGNNPAPLSIEGVYAQGSPPDSLHVYMSIGQLKLLLNAVGEKAVARGTKLAGEAIGGAIYDAVDAWQRKRRRRKLVE